MIEPRISDDLDATFEHLGDADSDLMNGLAEEFAERFRRGEIPSVDEYVSRYPQHASTIRDLLSSVGMMEQLKGHVRRSAGAPDDAAEPIPERLGEYRIIRELGRGGMGIVYEAHQESLGRHVALKVIPRHGLLEPKRRRRFQREAMAVAQLHHTNIVPIFAAGEHDGLPFYAMQYIRGKGLDRLLDGWRGDRMVPGPDHWRLVARVGLQAADALQYAHDQGIFHRDIKPANIIIDEHQVAWITDFGLAKLLGRDELTNSGDIVGTLRYLAPEALRGQTDHRADIYGLGLTLYELLTLRPPFGDLSPSELLRCVTDEQPARPRTLDRSIPVDLETIVLKATAREPADRYATAGDLADDLRAFLDDRPIRARRASPPERLARWCRRNRGLAIATGLAATFLLMALAAATWGYFTKAAALEREAANFRTSFKAIEDLFNEFIDPWDLGPFAGGAPPPRPSDAGPPRDGALRKPQPPPDDRPPPRPSIARRDQGRTNPPLLRKDRGPHAGPGMNRGMAYSERELAILETVLRFFDEFAERNETNAQLESEAARAYRKAAAIYRFFGRDSESETAYQKALKHFESLVRRHGEDSEYNYELARTLALDGPGAFGVPWDQAEPDLRRAIAMVERMDAHATESRRVTYAAALARWYSRLGKRLEQIGKPAEAADCFRSSLLRDEWLSQHLTEPGMIDQMLASRRADLAAVLVDLGRNAEARPLLERAEATLLEAIGENAQSFRGPGELVAGVLDSLAASYRGLDDAARAEPLESLAEQLRERSRQWRPGHRNGSSPGGPSMPPRAFGRGRP